MLLLLRVCFQKCENWKWNFVMTVSGLENTKLKMKNFTAAWKHCTSVAGKDCAKLIDDSQMSHVISKAACFLVTYQRELFSWWLLYIFLSFWIPDISPSMALLFLCKGTKAHQSTLSKNTSWVWTPCGLLWKSVQVFEFYSEQIYSSPTRSAAGLILYSSDKNMKDAAFLLLVCLPQSWLYGWLCWSLVLEGPWWVVV